MAAALSTRQLFLVVAVLTSIQLIFSGWHVLGKKALNDDVQPLVFAFYREISASICMAGIAFLTDGASFIRPARADIPRFLVLGACSFANVVGSVVALKFISAANYALLQPAVPVFAAAIAVVLRMEPLSLGKACGVLLAVAGAVVTTVLSPSSSEGSTPPGTANPVLGNVVTILAALGMALLVVLQKRVLQTYPANTVTFLFYSFGALLTAVALAIQAMWGAGPLGPVSAASFAPTQPVIWGALAYAMVFATVYNYCALTWANTKVPASIVAAFLTLQPIGTVILSLIFGLEKEFNGYQGLGGALVIAGLLVICVVQGRQQKQQKQEQQEQQEQQERQLLGWSLCMQKS